MKPSEATPLTGARKAWSSSEAATSEAWSSSEAATSSEKQEPATWSWTPRHLAAILFSAALSAGIAIPLTLWLTNCDARIDEARVEIEMSAPYEVWLCASFDTATPDRNVIWSYWDGQGVSPDFSPISASWQLWAPNFTVRMLGPQSARCFLPDIDFTRVKEVRLFTDLLRLRLLQKYGGVWLDSTVLLTAPLNIGAKGFRAEYRPELQMHGAPDFVESWMLVADKDEYIVSAWAELLERLIVLNGGVTAGISSADVYEPRFSATDMFEKLEHSGIIFDSNMREYLVVYVAFTYLCHTDDVFRDRVANATLIDTSTSGYLVQMRYSWDDHAWMDVLRAPLGSRPEHAEMLQAGHVKLSTQSPGIVELLAETTTPMSPISLPQPPSFIAAALKRTQSNAHSLTRDEMQLVIAQYDEDISWSEKGYCGVRCVYTKGYQGKPYGNEMALKRTSAPAPTAVDTYKTLPNVGRESHTFLTHVLDNYYNLPRYVVFAQGGLSNDHAWTRRDYGADMYLNMYEEARSSPSGCSVAPLLVDPDDPEMGDWNWDFSPHVVENTPTYKGENASKARVVARSSANNFGQWFRGVAKLQPSPDGRLRIYPGAEFSVSRERILSRPRGWYQKLREQVMLPAPMEGHYIERSWYYIFNCDGNTRKYVRGH